MPGIVREKKTFNIAFSARKRKSLLMFLGNEVYRLETQVIAVKNVLLLPPSPMLITHRSFFVPNHYSVLLVSVCLERDVWNPALDHS